MRQEELREETVAGSQGKVTLRGAVAWDYYYTTRSQILDLFSLTELAKPTLSQNGKNVKM